MSKSPFPGMDPWLEGPAIFPDLHASFATYLRAALTKVLPSPFFAAISTRVYMEASDRQSEPDVDVLSNEFNGGQVPVATMAASRSQAEIIEIASYPWPDDEITESFVEIRTTHGDERLISSIEILSLTNKTRGANGCGIYLAKQHEMRASGVNLIEIDLLRSGTHSTAASLVEIRNRVGPIPYHVCVSRADHNESVFVYPIRFDQSLPHVDIPLTSEVPSVSVDLQEIFDRCYDEGGYARRLHYNEPCQPPLNDDQLAWAQAILRDRGLLN